MKSKKQTAIFGSISKIISIQWNTLEEDKKEVSTCWWMTLLISQQLEIVSWKTFPVCMANTTKFRPHTLVFPFAYIFNIVDNRSTATEPARIPLKYAWVALPQLQLQICIIYKVISLPLLAYLHRDINAIISLVQVIRRADLTSTVDLV